MLRGGAVSKLGRITESLLNMDIEVQMFLAEIGTLYGRPLARKLEGIVGTENFQNLDLIIEDTTISLKPKPGYNWIFEEYGAEIDAAMDEFNERLTNDLKEKILRSMPR